MDDSTAALYVFCGASIDVDNLLKKKNFPVKPTSWLSKINKGELTILDFEVKALVRWVEDYCRTGYEYIIHLYRDDKVVATVTASSQDFTFYNGTEDAGDNILLSRSEMPSVSDLMDVVGSESSMRVAVALGVLAAVADL